MANNRIFYATQAVILTPLLQANDGWTAQTALCPRGLQSVGITTNFTLEQVYQLGQLELYDNIEDVPEVQVTMNKVIDGTMPLYLMCMGGGLQGQGKELAEIVNNRVNFRLQIYKDTNSAATGTPDQFVNATGMYLSSVSYTFPVDGNATEDVTLVGNNKFWNNIANGGGATAITNAAIFGTGGAAPSTARRYKLLPSQCSLPSGAGGIPNGSHFQSISVSTDLGREAIQELGSMTPYFRFVTFPLEVTSEFEIIAISGDQMDANDFTAAASCTGTYKNLTDKTIKVKVCGTGTTDYLELDLGAKNKLTSVNYTGGDAGGGNATITYSFQTFNKLKVNVTGSFTLAPIT
jgi:hypothetical protein